MAKSKVTICPYCGETQPAEERCRACGGLFESLSRRATHNAMGPWSIRDPDRPFQPGCSYETLVRMVQRGQISKLTLVRGPTTKQFWTIARHVPGLAHLLGYCHQCDAEVDPGEHGCYACGAPFVAVSDRNYLGLPELRPLPWETTENTSPESAALSASPQASAGAGELADQPRGGRLSSFATDEELLNRDDVDDQAWGGPQPGGGQASAPGSIAQATSPAIAPVEKSAAVAMAVEVAAPVVPAQPQVQAELSPAEQSQLRFAGRRILRLQSNAQRLWIVLGLSVALNVVLASLFMFPGGNAGVDEENQTAEQLETATNQLEKLSPVTNDSATDQPSVTEQGEAVSNTTKLDQEDLPAVTETETEAAAANDGEDNGPSSSPYVAMLAEAQQLIEAAKDDQRELSERITEYERAVELLEDVRLNAPMSVRPVDIADLIEQAERELERLRLREFFP